jgi:hypothetical protein
MKIYTDWAGDSGVRHDFINIPGTAGNNNRWVIGNNAANEFAFNIFDSAGGLRIRYLAGTSTNWSANGWKMLQACTSNTGTMIARHYNYSNSTWYNWSSVDNTGTGIQNGQSNVAHIGSSAGSFTEDAYVGDICFDMYNAGYSMCNWSSGTSPKKPY